MDKIFHKDTLEGLESTGVWTFWKKILFPLVGFISMVGGLLYVLYFAEGSSSPSSIVTIKAQCGPMKVKPHNPGGKLVPHTDKLVYECLQKDKIVEPTQETLLSGPEEPLEIPTEKMEISSYKPLTSQPPTLSLKKEKPLEKTLSPIPPLEKPKELENSKEAVATQFSAPLPSLKKNESNIRKTWYLQVGSFKTKKEAEREKISLISDIKSLRKPIKILPEAQKGKRKETLQILLLGPFLKEEEAQKAYFYLKKRKIQSTIKPYKE